MMLHLFVFKKNTSADSNYYDMMKKQRLSMPGVITSRA